ncbi:hypothetical protein DF268_41220 [Streptomyces sp. V2]|nr:hypothetical protein DF268_41220 [Streptomyces sp. V2]
MCEVGSAGFFSPPPPLPVPPPSSASRGDPQKGLPPLRPRFRGLRPLDPHRPEGPRPQTPDGLKGAGVGGDRP